MFFYRENGMEQFLCVRMKIVKINSFKVNRVLIFLVQTELEEILDLENTLMTFMQRAIMGKTLLSDMTGKRQYRRKSYEITKDSFIRVYPSIDDAAGRGGLRIIADLLKRLLKGSASKRQGKRI